MFLRMIRKMQKSNLIKVTIILLSFNFLIMGCASKTLIKSRPDGAEIFVDNIKMGYTPLEYEDTAIAGTAKPIKLKKEGYETFETVIRKSEFQPGPCIGGVLVLFPFIWVLGYPETYEFELKKLADGIEKEQRKLQDAGKPVSQDTQTGK